MSGADLRWGIVSIAVLALIAWGYLQLFSG